MKPSSFSGLPNQKTVFVALFILGIVFQSCTEKPKEAEQAGTKFDLAAAKTEIEEINKTFMASFAKGDSVGVASLYSTDGKLMFPEAPSFVGRAAIQTAVSAVIKSGVTRLNFETKEVFGNEDLLAEEGEVTVYVKDAAVAVDKYIVLWKKEDGKWMMFRDMSSPNAPAK
ncbi:YybH family protein [Dyadobacter arcticus]|uniref:Uncharacterized protein (TIGR02246 family) n=1 Tax=Dyadobacter arcticus TaxID=1078754 RepID=A0ABX0UNN6_9BACT|nr:nuclear transport factor 2 family protein [Dyadobacter arcticus]NIJ52686.1 uncharacterized protein (TIGR02246 family) [Dyadobacter arcticus]